MQCARMWAHRRDSLYVLIACEESQAECEAFRNLGHEAFSCDLQPCKPSGHPEWHIVGDCTPFLDGCTEFTLQNGVHSWVPTWDLIICHPPCTYLCKVSSVQMARYIDGECFVNESRFLKMLDGAAFFRHCLDAKAPFVAVENPLPMARAKLPEPSFFVDPSWFGVKYTKKTLYWVKNLPPIMAQCEHPTPKEFVRSSRGKYRSRTFPALAQALARQWADFIISEYEEYNNHYDTRILRY